MEQEKTSDRAIGSESGSGELKAPASAERKVRWDPSDPVFMQFLAQHTQRISARQSSMDESEERRLEGERISSLLERLETQTSNFKLCMAEIADMARRLKHLRLDAGRIIDDIFVTIAKNKDMVTLEERSSKLSGISRATIYRMRRRVGIHEETQSLTEGQNVTIWDDVRPKRIPIHSTLRFEILKRDGFRCQYCGANSKETSLHIDHILAIDNGGSNSPDNLITACAQCNLGKSNAELDTNIIPRMENQQINGN